MTRGSCSGGSSSSVGGYVRIPPPPAPPGAAFYTNKKRAGGWLPPQPGARSFVVVLEVVEQAVKNSIFPQTNLATSCVTTRMSGR